MPPNDRSRPDQGAATEVSTGLADLTRSYVSRLDDAIESTASDWWSAGAMLALKQLARSGRGFTVDHVVDMVGHPPDFHYLGALFASARRQKVIEPVGCRVGRDGRLVRIWWAAA